MNNSIPVKLDSMGFKQICNSEEETLDFIHNVKHQDHCIFMFYDEQSRDKIVKEFVNPKHTRNSVTACFSNNPTKYDCDHQISYDMLIQEEEFQPHIVSDFLLNVPSHSYEKDHTRIACEDTSWFVRHGVFDEHQKLGNSLDESVMNESAIMCCYNASNLNTEQMNTSYLVENISF